MKKPLSASEKLIGEQFFRLVPFLFLGIGITDLGSYLNGTFFLPPSYFLTNIPNLLETTGSLIFGFTVGIFYMRYKEYLQREKLK